MKHYDVITVGSATIDVFVKTTGDIIKITHPKKPAEELIVYPVGSKILIDKISFQTGGGGTNTAIALSRLGCKTAFLGKLGSDEHGLRVMHELKKEGVDFIGHIQRAGFTGYSVVLDSIKDDRTILTYKGVNNDLRYSEINKQFLNTKWFYFSSMVGESYKSLEKLADYAKQHNILVAFNPSSYLTSQGIKLLGRLLSKVHLLVLNNEEAAMLVGQHTAGEMLKKLRAAGPRIVVITDGKNGAYAFDGFTMYYCPAKKVRVVETTGAGDAFAASFLAGIIEKNDVEYATKLGIANSASVVQGHGAKDKLLHHKDILRQTRGLSVIKKRV